VLASYTEGSEEKFEAAYNAERDDIGR